MTIKQHGGIFGRNPTFNDVTVNDLTAGSGSSIEGSGSTVTFSVDRTDASTDGALVLRAAASSLSIDSNGANKDILIRTGGSTERARFYGDNGNFSIKGNLIVQTSGSGIDFSATSDASGSTSELFDDYEEGTWTPTLTRLTAGDFSYSASGADEGTYTKIGRMVYAKFRINGTFTESTASGAYVITGLPYTSPTNNHLFSVFYTSGGTVLDAVPRASDTRIQLLFTPTSGFNYVGGGFYTAS